MPNVDAQDHEMWEHETLLSEEPQAVWSRDESDSVPADLERCTRCSSVMVSSMALDRIAVSRTTTHESASPAQNGREV